jgi:hypothetical protein
MSPVTCQHKDCGNTATHFVMVHGRDAVLASCPDHLAAVADHALDAAPANVHGVTAFRLIRRSR